MSRVDLQVVFTPLKDDELFIKRYKVLCKSESSDANTFKVIKMNEDEKKDILFLFSTLHPLNKFIKILR